MGVFTSYKLKSKAVFLTIATTLFHFSDSGGKTSAVPRGALVISSIIIPLLVKSAPFRERIFLSVVFRVYEVAPVKVASLDRHNDYFCGGNVCCDRNVVHIAKTEKRGLVGIYV